MMVGLIILYLQILYLNLIFGSPIKSEKYVLNLPHTNEHHKNYENIVKPHRFGFINVETDDITLVPQFSDTRHLNSNSKLNDEKFVNSDQDAMNSNENLDLYISSDFLTSGSYINSNLVPIFHDLKSLLESLNHKNKNLNTNALVFTNTVNRDLTRIGRSDGSDSDSHNSDQNTGSSSLDSNFKQRSFDDDDDVISGIQPSILTPLSLSETSQSDVLQNQNSKLSSDTSKQGDPINNLSKTLQPGAQSSANLVLPTDTVIQEHSPQNLSSIFLPNASPNPNLIVTTDAVKHRRVQEILSTFLPLDALSNQNLNPLTGSVNLSNLLESISTSIPQDALAALLTTLQADALPNPKLLLSTEAVNQRRVLESLSTISPFDALTNSNIVLPTDAVNNRNALKHLSTFIPHDISPNPNLGQSTEAINQGLAHASLSTILPSVVPTNPNVILPTNAVNKVVTPQSLFTNSPPDAPPNSNRVLSTDGANQKPNVSTNPNIIIPQNTINQGETLASLLTILSPKALLNQEVPTTAIKHAGSVQNVQANSVSLRGGINLQQQVSTSAQELAKVSGKSLSDGINLQAPAPPSLQDMAAAQELVAMLQTLQPSQDIRRPLTNGNGSQVPIPPAAPMIHIPVMCNSDVCSALVPPHDSAQATRALTRQRGTVDVAQPGSSVSSRLGTVKAPASEVDVAAVHYLIAVTCNAGVCTANRISSSATTTTA